MINLLMILGVLLLFIGLPASIITLIVFAVKKKKVLVPAICIPLSFALSIICLTIGSYMYGKTDEYTEARKRQEIAEQEKQKEIKENKISEEKEQKNQEKTKKVENNKEKELEKKEEELAKKEKELKEREEKLKKKEKETKIKEKNTEEETEKNKKEDLENSKNQKEKTIEDGMERISSGQYLFITNEDLDKYSANMKGVNVYVVTEIDDIKEDMIQSNLSDGYMMSSFYVGERYEKYKSELKEGDIIGISGTIKENKSYGFMGNSVSLEDCMVFAVGENSEQYKKDSSDSGLSEYFTVTEDVANSGEKITEEEYKSLCEILNYEDILRNPEKNNGKYCKVEGTVDQVIEGWFGSFSIYVVDKNGDKWGCVYSYKDGESHLLAGDSVIMHGKCKGTDTTNTVLGEQVTLPRVDVEYIN